MAKQKGMRVPVGRSIRESARVLRGTLPRLLVFELLLRMFRTGVVRPLLSAVINGMMELSGDKLAFNGGMVSFFITPYGIVGGLIYLALAVFFIYFEFAVINIVLCGEYERRPIKLGPASLRAVGGFSALAGAGLLGFAAYTILLLPFVNSGLSSALFPSLSIPAFITGEMLKTLPGMLGLLAVALLAFFLMWALLFVLPVMMLEGRNFFGAVRRSWALRKTKGVSWVFALYFVLVGALSIGGYLAQMAILGVSEPPSFAVINALADLMTPGQALGLLGIGLLGAAGQILTAPILLALIVTVYMQTGPPLNPDTPGVRRVLALAARLRGFFEGLFPSLARPRKERPFLLRHGRGLLWSLALVGLFAAMFGTVYTYQPAASAHYVLGHRGSDKGVENTLEALGGAIDAGADYAEIDILLSKDSVPMVIHDASLQRLAGVNGHVADLTAAELEDLTLSQNGMTGRISTLEEVLRFCDGRQKLLIEFKKHGGEKDSVVAKTFEAVEAAGFQDQAIYHTMVHDFVLEAKALRPGYQVGFIAYGSLGSVTSESLAAIGSDFVVVEESMVDDRLMGESARANLPVFVWTVEEPESMLEYFEQGATAIITDTPEVGMEVLETMKGTQGSLFAPEDESGSRE